MIPIPEDFYLRAAVMLGDEPLIHSQFNTLTSYENPSWTRTWSNLSNKYISTISHTKGDLPILKRICASLSIACYPCIQDERRQRCYNNLKVWYKLLCIEEGYPVQYRHFTYKGLKIPYTTRFSKSHTSTNITILFIRGLDSTKEARYWDETKLLEKGYNIVSIDFPGMGENPAVMSVNSDQLFSELIRSALKLPELTSSKVICWGLGFGGYWAYKLAADDSNVIAAINQGGPIHFGFKPNIMKIIFNYSEIKFLSNMISTALRRSTSTRKFISKLSLLKQNKLKKICKPVLYINGNQDKTASKKDPKLLSAHIPERYLTSRVINNSGHLAIDALDEKVIPIISNWLDQNIDVNYEHDNYKMSYIL